MDEAKQLASVVDLVVSVNYNTLHIHRTWCSLVPARAMPGPAAAYEQQAFMRPSHSSTATDLLSVGQDSHPPTQQQTQAGSAPTE